MRLVFLILLLGPRFEACGGEEPETDRPLPREDVSVCSTDAECGADEMCIDVRCLAGTCTVVDDVLDRDADGESPLACGGLDCDDADATVSSRGSERCNARDDDCDGTVDEGAPADELSLQPNVLDAGAIVVPWGVGFAVVERTTGALFARPVDRDGVVGEPIEVLRLVRGSIFAELQAVTIDDTTTVLARTDLGALLFAHIGEASVIETGIVELDAQVLEARMVAHGGEPALALDVVDGTDPELLDRWVLATFEATPVVVLEDVSSLGERPLPLDIASTGAELVVPVTEGLAFVNDVSIETLVTPTSLAARPLASGDGDVVLAYDDGFGLTLRRFDRLGPVSTAIPGPVSVASETEIATFDGNLVVLGRTSSVRAAWILDPSLMVYLRSTVEIGLGGASSIALQPGATAVFGAGDGLSPSFLVLLLECA